jgi:hypothetical protein
MNKENIKNYAIFGKKVEDFLKNDGLIKDINNIVFGSDCENREYWIGYYRCLWELKRVIKDDTLSKDRDNTQFMNYVEGVFEKI